MTEHLKCKAGDATFVVLVNSNGERLQTALESRIESMTHIQTDGLMSCAPPKCMRHSNPGFEAFHNIK